MDDKKRTALLQILSRDQLAELTPSERQMLEDAIREIPPGVTPEEAGQEYLRLIREKLKKRR